MRAVFRQYFKPTSSELRELWDRGLFSFDASVLLSIYGYSSETRQELVHFLENNATRVRLPHQFGLEYARNRSGVIVKQVNKYLSVEKQLRDIKDNEIGRKSDHPYLTKKSLKSYQAIQDELAKSRKAIEKLIGSDPYAERLLAAFEGRVGEVPSQESLSRLHALAKIRYDQRVPPGFADLKKKEIPDAYGDCIAWFQLIEIAKSEQKDIILVIDDQKEDWWQKDRDRTVGPRPELLEEFARTTERRIHMYTSEGFLRAAKEFTSVEIRDDVIEEVTLRLASERETRRGADFKPVAADAAAAHTEKKSDGKVSELKKTSPSLREAAKGRSVTNIE